MINSSQKLSGKSPVLSIENVSQLTKDVEKLDIVRKYSDAESIGRKLATLPKFNDGINTNRLHPGDRLHMGKSDETLTKSENYNDKLQTGEIIAARSYQNILDGTKKDLEVEENACSNLNLTAAEKRNLSDDEIAKRNKSTIEQLRCQLNEKIESIKPQIKRTTSNTTTMPSHPAIRIEDTSKHEKISRSLDRPDIMPKETKLSKNLFKPDIPPKEKLSKSLDRSDIDRTPKSKPNKSLEEPDVTPKDKLTRSLDRPDVPPKEKHSRSIDPPREKPSRMEKRLEEMCKQDKGSWTMDKTSWSMDRRMEEASKQEKARMEREKSFGEKEKVSRSVDRRIKHRHRSLGDVPKSPLPPEPLPPKRNRRVTEHSR